MLAFLEAVPYIAFVAAGLLIAFVAGEALYKKFLSLRLGAFGAKPVAVASTAPISPPAPKVTVQNVNSDRVQIVDETLNVRIEGVAEPVAAGADSDRQATASQDSGQNSATSEQMQPVITGALTERIPAVAESERFQSVPNGEEDAKLGVAKDESLEEGDLCNEVFAIRREPSVRVFDAVVAPSERKSSAA